MMSNSSCCETPQADDDDELDSKTAALDIRESMEKSKEFWGDQSPDQSIIPATLLKCPPNGEELNVLVASELAHLAWDSMSQIDFEVVAKINKDLLTNGEISVNHLMEPINNILTKTCDETRLKQTLNKIDNDYQKAIILVANQLLYISDENVPPSIAEEEADVGANVRTKQSPKKIQKKPGINDTHKAIKHRIKQLLDAAIDQGLGEIKIPKGIYVNERAKLTLLERQIKGRLRLKHIIENCPHKSPNTKQSKEILTQRKPTLSKKYDLSKRIKNINVINANKIPTENMKIGDQKVNEDELHKEHSSLSAKLAYLGKVHNKELTSTSLSEGGLKTKTECRNVNTDLDEIKDINGTASINMSDSSTPESKHVLDNSLSREESVLNIQNNIESSSGVRLHKCDRENLKLRLFQEDIKHELIEDDLTDLNADLNEIVNNENSNNFTQLENLSETNDLTKHNTDLTDVNVACCSQVVEDQLSDEINCNMQDSNVSATTESSSIANLSSPQISLASDSSSIEKNKVGTNSEEQSLLNYKNSDSEVAKLEYYKCVISNLNISSDNIKKCSLDSEIFLNDLQMNIIDSAIDKIDANNMQSSSNDLKFNQTDIENKAITSFMSETSEIHISKLNLISEERSSSSSAIKLEAKEININEESGCKEKFAETYEVKNQIRDIEKRRELSLILRDSLSEVHAKTTLLFAQTYNVDPPTETAVSISNNNNNNLNPSVHSLDNKNESIVDISCHHLSEESTNSKIVGENKYGDTDIENSVIDNAFKNLTRVNSDQVSGYNIEILESDSNNQAFDVGTFPVDELNNSTNDIVVNEIKCETDREEYNKQKIEDNNEEFERELAEFLECEDQAQLKKQAQLKGQDISDEDVSEEEENDEDDDDEEEDDDGEEDDDYEEVHDAEEDDAEEDDEDDDEEDEDEEATTTVDEDDKSLARTEKSVSEIKINNEKNLKKIDDKKVDSIDSKRNKGSRGDNTLLYVTIFLGMFTATYFSDYGRQFFSSIVGSTVKANAVICLDKAIDVMTKLKVKLQQS